MPLNYLRAIQHADFPLQVTDPREVDCVAVLLAAGLVEASLPSPTARSDEERQSEVAIVQSITVLGRVELARTGG